MVLVGVFIFLVNAFKPQPQQPPTQEVVTKNEDKTYLKYVALKEDKVASGSPTIEPPTATPTPTLKPSVTSVASNGAQTTLTPQPTEIILAVNSPTATAEAQAQSQPTSAPTTVASLPTTGNITGSVFVFLVSLSMIAFAFVL